MKALIAFLITPLAAAVFVGAIAPCLSADEANSHNGTLAPAAAAAIFPRHRSVGQLSGSEFVSGSSADPSSSDHDAQWRRRWAISLVPLFASQALDATSSHGMRELNPLLASANGGFGTKAAVLKFGVVGALAGTEYFLVKTHPASAKFFTIVNWFTSGATAGLAAHNFALR